MSENNTFRLREGKTFVVGRRTDDGSGCIDYFLTEAGPTVGTVELTQIKQYRTREEAREDAKRHSSGSLRYEVFEMNIK